MRRHFWYLAVALLAAVPVADASWPGSGRPFTAGGPPPSSCTQGAAFVDGCPAAPSGPPQVPALYSGYAVRPPWNATGVDYHAGYPAGLTLLDPATISMAGVTVNAGAHTVTISGSNVVLTGYDFGLANGWEVIVTGANATVQNSHFKVGTNQGGQGTVLSVSTAASNFSFLSNEVDGNNIGVTSQVGYTLGFANTGSLTVRYNYLHNSGGDMVEMNNVNLSNQLIQYNLLQDIGYITPHSDTIQWCGSRMTAGDVSFNTINQTQAGLSGEGLLVLNSECSGSNISNVTVRNNTLISKVRDNFITGVTVEQDAGSATGSSNAVYANYTDPTGSYANSDSPWFPTHNGPPAPGGTLGIPAALHDLIDMRSGSQIVVPTQSAPTNGWYVDPDINGNSASRSDIFTITPSPSTGNVVTGQTVTLTLTMDAPTTVIGTPKLLLNSGGSAVFSGGSGTKSLAFNYTVGPSDSATTLAVNSITLNSAPISSSYGLVFDDEFNGNTLNPANWTTGWFGSGITQPVNSFETACYGPTQVVVNNGLSLNSILQTNTCGTSRPYLSGLITSTNNGANPPLQQFTFGYFEAKMTLPASSSQIANWPAWWLNSQNNPVTGEIDIMEGLNGQACSTFHNSSGQQQTCPSGSFTGTHIFGALWSAGNVSWYYDNTFVGAATSGITSSPMYMILDQAMSAQGNFGGPVLAPTTVGVNWVHVYQAGASSIAPQPNYAGPGGGVATMTDDVGNVTRLSPLTNVNTVFSGLSVNTGGGPTLSFNSLIGGTINSTAGISGTYTGAAPSGLTNATFGGGCVGSATITGFNIPTPGNWTATTTTPSTPCTGTETVTGTGSNTASGTSPPATFTGGGGGTPVITVSQGSFTGSVSTTGNKSTLATSGSVTGTLAFNQYLYQGGTAVSRIISNAGGANWSLNTALGTLGSQAFTSLKPIYASSTSGLVSEIPPVMGSPAATSGQLLTTNFGCSFCANTGALQASNGPTSWSLSSCSGPGGVSCVTWFAISASGVLTVTSTGASNIAPTKAGALYNLNIFAANGSGNGPTQTVPVVFFADGALSASGGGTPQFPTFYSGYAFRPPWQVPDVDYAIGLPPGTTLRDPTAGGLPAGCSFSSPYVTCSTSGVTVSGFDFSLHNGLGLQLAAANISVKNNNFATPSGGNRPTPFVPRGGAFYLGYTTMNGMQTAPGSGDPATVTIRGGTGAGIIDYTIIENSGEDVIDINGGQYSLLLQHSDLHIGGFSGHPDFFQPDSGSGMTFQANFNLVVNQTPPSQGSQGFAWGDNGSPMNGSNTSDNNMFAVLGNPGSFNFVERIVPGEFQAGATMESIDDYVDATGILDGFATGASSGTIVYRNIICMKTGVGCSTAGGFASTP